MQNNIALKRIYLAVLFLVPASSLQAELSVAVTPRTAQDNLVKHYGVHAATGFAAMFVAVVSFVAGAAVSHVANPGILNRIRTHQYFEFREAGPIVAGMVAGVYCIYKTPQWTDTYVLGCKDKRTDKQNVITFINRVLIPVPFGVLAGEYLAGTDAYCYKP